MGARPSASTIRFRRPRAVTTRRYRAAVRSRRLGADEEGTNPPGRVGRGDAPRYAVGPSDGARPTYSRRLCDFAQKYRAQLRKTARRIVEHVEDRHSLPVGQRDLLVGT